MDLSTVGIVFIGIGIALVVLSGIFLRMGGAPSVKADRGGVIVKGGNSGVVNTGKVKGDVLRGGSSKSASSDNSFWTWMGRIGTICSILGLLMALGIVGADPLTLVPGSARVILR